MENNEVKEVREYTSKDVLKILYNLSEEEMGTMLIFSTVSGICDMLNDAEKYDSHLNNTKLCAYYYNVYANILENLRDRVDTLLEDDTKDFSAEYDELNDSDKKRVALEMLNDTDFQKNLCEIMLGDFERIVAEDPAYKAIDNFLGVGKFFRKCIETGLGCDHKYEVL